MNYHLAKELYDAGFPQGGKGTWAYPPDKLVFRPSHRIYVPTLSELIEACGEDFFQLFQLFQLTKGSACWYAKAHIELQPLTVPQMVQAPTPEEAVARLWLALNKT